MTKPASLRRPLLLLAVLPLVGSCNPDLLNAISGGSGYPLAPGSVDMVQVFVYNLSSSHVVFNVMSEDADIGQFTVSLNPLIGALGTVYRCPTKRIGLGNLDDPTETDAAVVTGLSGISVNVAFGQPALVEGVSYQCGDTLFLVAADDSRQISGVSFGAGLYSGSQQGPVTKIETFQVVQNILLREDL